MATGSRFGDGVPCTQQMQMEALQGDTPEDVTRSSGPDVNAQPGDTASGATSGGQPTTSGSDSKQEDEPARDVTRGSLRPGKNDVTTKPTNQKPAADPPYVPMRMVQMMNLDRAPGDAVSDEPPPERIYDAPKPTTTSQGRSEPNASATCSTCDFYMGEGSARGSSPSRPLLPPHDVNTPMITRPADDVTMLPETSQPGADVHSVATETPDNHYETLKEKTRAPGPTANPGVLSRKWFWLPLVVAIAVFVVALVIVVVLSHKENARLELRIQELELKIQNQMEEHVKEAADRNVEVENRFGEIEKAFEVRAERGQADRKTTMQNEQEDVEQRLRNVSTSQRQLREELRQELRESHADLRMELENMKMNVSLREEETLAEVKERFADVDVKMRRDKTESTQLREEEKKT